MPVRICLGLWPPRAFARLPRAYRCDSQASLGPDSSSGLLPSATFSDSVAVLLCATFKVQIRTELWPPRAFARLQRGSPTSDRGLPHKPHWGKIIHLICCHLLLSLILLRSSCTTHAKCKPEQSSGLQGVLPGYSGGPSQATRVCLTSNAGAKL